MDNSPHKGVYQLNYADNLTTEKAWNVAMVICVIQVRRERLSKLKPELQFGCSAQYMEPYSV